MEGTEYVDRAAPGEPVCIHTPDGKAFLGARLARDGSLEVVYDRLGVGRSIWKVTAGSVGLAGMQEACQRAVNARDCMAVLYQALAEGGIKIECIEERFLG